MLKTQQAVDHVWLWTQNEGWEEHSLSITSTEKLVASGEEGKGMRQGRDSKGFPLSM